MQSAAEAEGSRQVRSLGGLEPLRGLSESTTRPADEDHQTILCLERSLYWAWSAAGVR